MTNAPRQKHKAWSVVYFGGGKDMEIELSGISGKHFHDIFFEKADVLPFLASHFVGGCFVAGAGVVCMIGNVYVLT